MPGARTVDAINVLVYFYSYTTPHPDSWLRNYKMFSPFNTWDKMNHIDNKRPAPLSMNGLTTEYWNSYKYFVIQNVEILGIKPKL